MCLLAILKAESLILKQERMPELRQDRIFPFASYRGPK